MHARRYCRKSGLKPLRCRSGAAFDSSGIKTEYTIVELECSDNNDEKKLVRLLVWVFGVRQVLESEPPAPPPRVHQELHPQVIPCNPSTRSIVFFFGYAIFVCAVGAFFHWPRPVQVVTSVLSLGAAVLFCLRRYLWPQQIVLSESTMTVPVGFLCLRPVCVNYSDITAVWVVLIGPTLCVQTSQRTIQIPGAYLADQETFDLLRNHFDSLVPTQSWEGN